MTDDKQLTTFVNDEDDLAPDTIMDKSNPRSVYNMVPRSMQRGMDNIPAEYWELTAEQFEKSYKDIGETDRKLRESFWYEYDLAQRGNRAIIIANVIRGICIKQTFSQTIMGRPHRLRYILDPPSDYRVSMQEILRRGLKELGKIIDADLYVVDKDGNRFADAKLAAVKLKTVEMLYNRLQGMPIHRSMQITENVNRNYNSNSQERSRVVDFSNVNDVEKLEQIVQQLESGNRNVMEIIPDKVEEGAKDGQWVGVMDDDKARS